MSEVRLAMRGRVMETVADIAYQAGVVGYYSGDSRKDATMFIQWAAEFERARTITDEHKELYFGEGYVSAIERFTERKLLEQIERL